LLAAPESDECPACANADYFFLDMEMNSTPEAPVTSTRSNYRAPLITLLCSFLLAGGSCFGFLTTLNFNHEVPINTFFAAGFGVCVLVFLGSVLWMIVKAIRGRHGGNGAGQ
jgi:hypothetical protein